MPTTLGLLCDPFFVSGNDTLTPAFYRLRLLSPIKSG